MRNGFAILITLIIIAMVISIGSGSYFLSKKNSSPQKVTNNLVDQELSATEQKRTYNTTSNLYDCFKKTQIPKTNSEIIVSRLTPQTIGTYKMTGADIPEANQFPSLLGREETIRIKAAVAPEYSSDINSGGFDLEIIVVEYFEDNKEDFEFYRKLIEDEESLKAWRGDQTNISNPSYDYIKEIEGLRYWLDLEPNSEHSKGTSGVVAVIPERNMLIMFSFQKYEPQAEEIFKTWAKSICI